jgi:putative nucleotidyltransferase with HDIG domain
MTHYVENIHVPTSHKKLTKSTVNTEKWTRVSSLTNFLLGSDTTDELISRSLIFISDLLELDHCLAILINDNGQYTYRASRSSKQNVTKLLLDIRLSLIAEDVLNRLFKSEKFPSPKPIDEIATKIEQLEFDFLEDRLGYWVVPMKVDNEIVGALFLGKQPEVSETVYLSDSFYMVELFSDQIANAIQRSMLNERLINLSIETVLALSKTLEARDLNSGSHSKRITSFTERLASSYGFSVRDTREVCWAALLHDIGKIGVEDHILNKQGPLTKKEWDVIKTHPEVGANIIRGLSGLEKIAPLISAHHERIDGTGYPKGLKQDDIPLGARIISVVDSYTAMTEGRVYQQARSHDEAVLELKRYSGKMYDPEVVRKFVQLFEDPETIT